MPGVGRTLVPAVPASQLTLTRVTAQQLSWSHAGLRITPVLPPDTPQGQSGHQGKNYRFSVMPSVNLHSFKSRGLERGKAMPEKSASIILKASPLRGEACKFLSFGHTVYKTHV